MPAPLAPGDDLWRQAATATEPWLEAPDASWSFQHFLRRAQALGEELNLQAGERVAVVAAEPVPTLLTLLAAWLRGALVAPLNPAFPESRRQELQQQIGASRWIPSGAVRAQGAVASEPLPDLDLTRPATVVFTSGSSGTPKAAVLSLGNFLWNASGANAVMPLGPGDRWLLSIPLFHVGGLSIAFRTLLAGATMVLPQERSTVVPPPGVTHVSLVPTQLQRLLNTAEGVAALRTLKLILIGGAGVAPSLLERCGALGLPVQASYGSTEMASQVATGPLVQENGAWKVAARLLPGRELRVQALAEDGSGEIEVRGPTRFLGYQQEDTLQQPFDAEGWFSTGDLGRLVEGVLEVRGRRDAMFISGGENVHPETVERALLDLPDLAQAIVVPVDDEEFGARPVAFVEAPEVAWTPNTWAHDLRRTLAGFQVPELFLPWPTDVAAGLKPRRPELALQAQPLYDQWVQYRPLRRWLRQSFLGWRPVWQVGSGQVFEVIHHQLFPEPQACLVLAQTRQEVVDWLRELGAAREALPWKPLSRPRNNRVEDVLEVVRLLAEDLPPEVTEALDLQTQQTIPFAPLVSRTSPVFLPRQLELSEATLVLPPAEAGPLASGEQVLQIGACLSGVPRFFRLRLLFRSQPDERLRFLGWKVQSLREADGTVRDQPFWDLSESEEARLASALRQLPWIAAADWATANTSERERSRRFQMNQYFKCDLRQN